ncbi:50S ribosomal protein L24 [Candidatus Nanosalina sp. VS9-1]|uniref:50S ribosomal protein L24 n=1 Tax=Candidatus Nanosalina sp. VS9-1 TaxID=3388566 RepID=UPI0039E086DA
MKQKQNWSSSWKSSTDPQKQRKYRQNAPQHVKDDFISANLSHDLRDELETRNLGLRNGDRVRVMRGDRKGAEGIVNEIDRENERIFIDGVEDTAVDGSKRQIPLRPSNVQIQGLNLSDERRLEKFAVEDFEEIKVSDEEVEEALETDEEEEMMQQLQGGGEPADTGDLDEEEIEKIEEEIEEEIDEEDIEDMKEEASEEDEEESSVDYSDVVSSNIGEVKEAVEGMESPDFDALIEAEKAGKDRKTMIEYLENQKEE